MLTESDPAPDFELPGTDGGEFDTYLLSDYTDAGAVVLSFYPFDFSPICSDQLCGFRDAEFLSLTEDVDVFGISTDACYAHRRFIEENNLPFPLLSDTTGRVTQRFGIAYDEWELHEGIPKRSVYILDDEQRIQYAWSTDDAYESPLIETLGTELKQVLADQ